MSVIEEGTKLIMRLNCQNKCEILQAQPKSSSERAVGGQVYLGDKAGSLGKKNHTAVH